MPATGDSRSPPRSATRCESLVMPDAPANNAGSGQSASAPSLILCRTIESSDRENETPMKTTELCKQCITPSACKAHQKCLTPTAKEPPSSGSERRLIRCPWCASSNVWTYAWNEWRCEKCAREWTGTSALAASSDGRCDICKTVVGPEDSNGCRNCGSEQRIIPTLKCR